MTTALIFEVHNPNRISLRIEETGLWDVGKFVHAVISVSGQKTAIFKNGEKFASGEGIIPVDCARDLFIGKDPYGESFFEGTIAYLRVWHGRALVAQDAKALYETRNEVRGRSPQNVQDREKQDRIAILMVGQTARSRPLSGPNVHSSELCTAQGITNQCMVRT